MFDVHLYSLISVNDVKVMSKILRKFNTGIGIEA